MMYELSYLDAKKNFEYGKGPPSSKIDQNFFSSKYENSY